MNKTYLKEKVIRSDIELFNRINEDESEENAKGHFKDFLNSVWYKDEYLIATKERADLVIHNAKKATSTVGVLFEVKRPKTTIRR